jgi:hypothetical protein
MKLLQYVCQCQISTYPINFIADLGNVDPYKYSHEQYDSFLAQLYADFVSAYGSDFIISAG